MKNGILLAIAIAVLTMLAPGSQATVNAQFSLVEGPLGQSPFGTPPADAVGWFVINDEIGVVGIGHRDAAFGIPGRANPFNLQLVNPYEPHLANGASADADWGQGPTCKQNNVEVWHLHTNRAGFDPLPEGTFPSEFGLNPHVDPARGFCGHGKLGWLFAEIGFADEDDDGVGDADDLCPGTAAAATVDANGCAPDQLGTVVIKKVTVPPDLAGTFSFTHDFFNGGGTFDLTHGDEITFNNVPARPEVYTVTETVATGFTFGVWECRRPDGSLNTAGGQGDAFIIVNDNETITCTFPNLADSDNDSVPDSEDFCPGTPSGETVDANGCSPSQQPDPGTVIIKKVTDPTGSAVAFSFTQNIDTTGPISLTDGQQFTFVVVPAGTYKVTEDVAPGFMLEDWVCIWPTGSIDGTTIEAEFQVRPGETITCTFFNSENPPKTGTVIVKKETIFPDSTVFSFTHNINGGGDFGLSKDGELVFLNVVPDRYFVMEGVSNGSVLSSWDCLSPAPRKKIDGTNPRASFVVVGGETITCTFLNDRDSDNDGVGDTRDFCPDTPAGQGVDSRGCSPSQETSIVCGDVHPAGGGDGDDDILDALRKLKIAVGLVVPTARELIAGDVHPDNDPDPDGDGDIDVLDALRDLKASVGLVVITSCGGPG